eukprot:TRINITY_DN12986_c0_g1_i1.p1 TRINITY_DN12986_c0_g1~~TRINITY_DN12986_c0_g1_i1.p1  ORF type:complete len:306 (-),score=56.12 TRINITY_DN12986_c0_g1_i1:136-1053(-)
MSLSRAARPLSSILLRPARGVARLPPHQLRYSAAGPGSTGQAVPKEPSRLHQGPGAEKLAKASQYEIMLWCAGFAGLTTAWYLGWFDWSMGQGTFGSDWSKAEKMVNWLDSQGIKVVAFELDGVIRGKTGEDAIPRHEAQDYIAGTSKDFIIAARTLSRHGFGLALASTSDEAACSTQGRSPASHMAGEELTKMLLRQRCPEAQEHFRVMVGYDPKLHGQDAPSHPGGEKYYHVDRISQHYRVSMEEICLVDVASKTKADKDTYPWVTVPVRDPKEGFQFEDVLELVGAGLKRPTFADFWKKLTG